MAGLWLACSPAASREATVPPPDEKPADPSSPYRRNARPDSNATRDRVVVMSMACILFCVTGCEHGVATWLPTFGEKVGGVPVQMSAVISSAYWGAICAGRLHRKVLQM